MKIRVLTDSGGLMSQQQAHQYDIDYLPLQVTIGEKTYMDGIDLSTAVLYDEIEKGLMPQTSQPPMGFVEELFDSYNEQGVTDVILITLSSGLSGTNNNVYLCGMRHDIKVHTLDIYSTLGMEKFMALFAKELVDQEVDPEEIIRRLKVCVEYSAGYLIVEDLDHLCRGGRLTPMAAKLGGMLKIKPILEVSKRTEGRVDIYEKVRTISKAVKKACKIITGNEYINAQDYLIVLMDSRAPENAQIAEETLRKAFPDIEIVRDDICAVIAAHTGLKAVGIQFVRKAEGIK